MMARLKLNHVLGMLLVCGAMLSATSAAAQEGGDRTVIIFTPALLTTTAGVAVFAVVSMVNTATTSSTSSSTSANTFHSHRAVTEQYVAQSALELSQDIALGGGDTLEDLALLAQLAPEDVSAFAALLRAERAHLMPLLSGEVDQATASQFIAHIEAAMSLDPQLARYTTRS